MAAELRLRYGLPGGTRHRSVRRRQRCHAEGLAGYDRLSFTIRAEHPMRLSVQLRAPVAGGEARALAAIDLPVPRRYRANVWFERHVPVGRDGDDAMRRSRKFTRRCSSSTR